MSALRGKENSGTKKKQKLISFASVQGGSGKTTLAYISAMLAARTATSAYVNMEDFGYTEHLYQVNFETSMEDVMFALKDTKFCLAELGNDAGMYGTVKMVLE